MKYKQPSFLLAVILASAAPILADKIPTASKNESKDAVSAQALAENQGLHNLYATGDCGLSGAKQNEVRSTSMFDTRTGGFTQGDKSMSLGALVNAGVTSSNHPVTVDDLGSNERKFSHTGEGKSRGKGNGKTNGGGNTSAPAIAVPEPGSRLLLLVGLAGLGFFFLRRNSYQTATE